MVAAMVMVIVTVDSLLGSDFATSSAHREQKRPGTNPTLTNSVRPESLRFNLGGG